MKSVPVLALFITAMLAVQVSATTIRVPADQPTIQAAIDVAAPGDVVLVADGVYTGEGNRDIDFLGKEITVRSENGPANCIIDCQGSEADPHHGFLFREHEDRGSVLEGFTVRNGYNSPSGSWGGAIACQNHARPTIRNNVMSGNYALNGGAVACYSNAEPLITGNRIENNQAYKGGAIFGGADVAPVIEDNLISGNSAAYAGGGIHLEFASTTITGNIITGNETEGSAGGVSCTSCDDVYVVENLVSGNRSVTGIGGMHLYAEYLLVAGNVVVENETEGGTGGLTFGTQVQDGSRFINNLVADNRAAGACGGISFFRARAMVQNNTITGNEAGAVSGAVQVTGAQYQYPLVFENNIVFNNPSPQNYEIWLQNSSSGGFPPVLHVSHSDVWGGLDATYVCPGGILEWGEGMIDADPWFTTGPGGEHYLSQVAAGQSLESLCVDRGGEPAADISVETPDGQMSLAQLTTRSDLAPDTGIVDLGYHYPGYGGPLLVTGPGPAENNPPLVRLFPAVEDAAHDVEFSAYGASGFGVNVASGDIDGIPGSELVTGAGPGAIYGPHVRGFTVDGAPIDGMNFLAYGTSKWGVSVTAGDLDGDGTDEIITGAGPGAVFGPHVRGFSFNDGTITAVPGVSFFAYGTPKWGVNVTTGDIDGDGFDEIVTGPGPGPLYGAHVRGWDIDGGTAAAITAVSFFAYNTPNYGLDIACCDVDGDGMDEMVTAPGPSPAFAAHIRGWNYDGLSVTPLAGFSFFAWDAADARYGASVGPGSDLDGDGSAEFTVCPGPDPDIGSMVKVYRYHGGEISLLFSLQAYPVDWNHGSNAAATVVR